MGGDRRKREKGNRGRKECSSGADARVPIPALPLTGEAPQAAPASSDEHSGDDASAHLLGLLSVVKDATSHADIAQNSAWPAGSTL